VSAPSDRASDPGSGDPTNTFRFRDRTLTWFRDGDDGLDAADDEYADPAPRSRRWRSLAPTLLVGSVALVAALWWLI
jgi:hypothetical protein